MPSLANRELVVATLTRYHRAHGRRGPTRSAPADQSSGWPTRDSTREGCCTATGGWIVCSCAGYSPAWATDPDPHLRPAAATSRHAADTSMRDQAGSAAWVMSISLARERAIPRACYRLFARRSVALGRRSETVRERQDAAYASWVIWRGLAEGGSGAWAGDMWPRKAAGRCERARRAIRPYPSSAGEVRSRRRPHRAPSALVLTAVGVGTLAGDQVAKGAGSWRVAPRVARRRRSVSWSGR